MFKRLLFIIILGVLSACSAVGNRQVQESPPASNATPTVPAPSAGVGEASATALSQPQPSRTSVLPSVTPTFAPLASWTPTPTWTGTPPTPTQLAKPYLIDVLDWEIIKATSPDLCAGCAPGVTSIDVPRGLGIALVQVFIEGASGTRASLTTDLLYASPEKLGCSRQNEEEFCGMVFGQIYGDQLTLSAEYIAGSTHRLSYIVTFQNWARYNP